MSNYRYEKLPMFIGCFKALSNSSRLEIFLRLIDCCKPGSEPCSPKRNSACVGELGRDLGLAPSTVSHHIKELSRVGLIKMERMGQNVECSVDEKVLGDLRRFFSDCCEASFKNYIKLSTGHTG